MHAGEHRERQGGRKQIEDGLRSAEVCPLSLSLFASVSVSLSVCLSLSQALAPRLSPFVSAH